MNDNIKKIYENDDILFSNYVIFYAGTKLNPHKDPNILRHPYKRIQIPLHVPKGECYMQWTNLKFEKIKWEEGVPQVCVMCVDILMKHIIIRQNQSNFYSLMFIKILK